MNNHPRRRETGLAGDDRSGPSGKPSAPVLTNVQAIMDLERQTREKRSSLDRVTDAVSGLASSPAFIIVHISPSVPASMSRTWIRGWTNCGPLPTSSN